MFSRRFLQFMKVKITLERWGCLRGIRKLLYISRNSIHRGLIVLCVNHMITTIMEDHNITYVTYVKLLNFDILLSPPESWGTLGHKLWKQDCPPFLKGIWLAYRRTTIY